jgi:hypothetical protein
MELPDNDFIDICPRGEESMHIPHKSCECGPRLERDDRGRRMIIHNSWDGREAFALAEQNLPAGYKGRRAA